MEKVVNKWKGLPDKIFEKILLLNTESSVSAFAKCNTYQNII